MNAGGTMKPLVRLGREPGECWKWLGPQSSGYPHKTFNGQCVPARKWLWMQLFGPLPARLIVTTTCGAKDCMNPHHFVACTQGEANRAGDGATLLPADVHEIKKHAASRGHVVAKVLAEQFGVTTQTIYDIWGRRSWRQGGPSHGPRSLSPHQAVNAAIAQEVHA